MSALSIKDPPTPWPLLGRGRRLHSVSPDLPNISICSSLLQNFFSDGGLEMMGWWSWWEGIFINTVKCIKVKRV